MIILCMCNLEQHANVLSMSCGHTYHNIICGCKNNISNGDSNRFGSSGYYYSFVDKDSFGIVDDNSSAGKYTTKNSKVKEG